MKILLYAPQCTPTGVGSYAYQNLRAPLLRFGFEIIDFDFLAANQKLGKAAATTALVQLIEKEKPDIFFHLIVEDELDADLAAKLKADPKLLTMVWFSDDEWRLSHSLQWVALYDVAFSTAAGAMESYHNNGHHHVVLVPYACNEQRYYPLEREKCYDVTFVGQPYRGRPELITALLDAGINVRVWGQGWEQFPRLRSIARGFLPHEEMLEVFAQSRIVLGLAWCSIDGVTPQIKGRTFEYPACRAFQLTNENPWLSHYFSDDEIVRYGDINDLVQKIRYYLAHDAERELVVDKAYLRTVSEHTWVQRFENAFSEIVQRGSNKGKSFPRCIFSVAPDSLAVQNKSPRVSVICYVYNLEKYIEDTVSSVLAQTYTDFEFLILDDGSTDNTANITRRFASDPRLRYVYQENIGKSLDAFDQLLNRSIAMTRGELVAFIGGDDEYAPDALAAKVAEFDRNAEVEIVFSDGEFINENGDVVDGGFRFAESLSFNRVNLLRTLFKINIVPHPAVMMRRSTIDRFGGFETGFASDYQFWLKAAPYCLFKFLDSKLLRYRVHPKGASTGTNNKTWTETQRLLLDMRRRVTILDIFPELVVSEDVDEDLLYAAYIEFGNLIARANIPVYELAVQEYMNALQHGPQEQEALNNAAVMAAMMGSHQQALRLLQNLATFSDHAVVAHNLAEVTRGGRALHLMELPHTHRFYEQLGRSEHENDPELQTSATKRSSPFFSVIFTVYNRPHLANNALQSIIDQSFTDFEIVMVNDGGVSHESLLQWQSSDIDIIYLRQPNRGVAAARNAALKIARGRYVVYLDDDDVMNVDHLKKFHQKLCGNPDVIIFCDAEVISEKVESGLRKDVSKTVLACQFYSFELLQVQNYIGVNCFSHPLDVIQSIGYFDESLDSLEDWEFLIRLSRVKPFLHMPVQTVQIRYRGQGDQRTEGGWDGMREVTQEIYRRHDDLGNPLIANARANVLAAEHPSRADIRELVLALGDPRGVYASEKAEKENKGGEYQAWLDRKAPSLTEIDGFALRYKARGEAIRFELLTMLHPGEEQLLANTLDGLGKLLGQNWRLIVAAETQAPDVAFLEQANLAWIQVSSVTDDSTLAEVVNHVLEQSESPFIAALPAGFTLEPHVLLMVEDYFERYSAWQALYLDHDQLGPDGLLRAPQLKPDFDPYYLSCFDYIGETLFWRREALLALGGLQAYPGAEQLDALLRLYEQEGRTAIGHVAEPVLHLPSQIGAQPLRQAARQVAVEEHWRRQGIVGQIGPSLVDDVFFLDFALTDQPLVSIVIPNRDQFAYLKPCIESLLEKTAYPNYELVIVDNASCDPDVLAYYDSLNERLGERFTLLHYDAPFNFSAQVNMGVSLSRGDYVVLLNNDTEIIQPQWLQRMLALALQNNVGAVGARLLFPETGKIQHAGVMMGGVPFVDGIAHHQLINSDGNQPGYMNRICAMQTTAVTAACMLVNKAIYQELGGFDAENLAVLFNDVDYCLRLDREGIYCVYQPFASLVHHGSISVGSTSSEEVLRQAESLSRSLRERDYMLNNWRSRMANYAAGNRNQSLTTADLRISELAVPWDPQLKHRPALLASRVQGGSGEYRVEQPLQLLREQGLMHTAVLAIAGNGDVSLPTVLELTRLNCDGLLLQSPLADNFLNAMKNYRKFLPELKLFVTVDDLLGAVPEKSNVYIDHQRHFRDARSRLRKALSYADRLIVSTQPLADAFADMVADVRVVPNRLRTADWGHLRKSPAPYVGRKLRVGWVGAQQHKGDLELIEEVIRQTHHEVDWIFMGMWPESVTSLLKETHKGVPFQHYPQAVAGMALDLAIAPLEDLPFNACKSNLRLLEYGALGWPVLCSDVYPYRTDDAPVCRLPDDPQCWIAAIRERVANPQSLQEEGARLYDWVNRSYWLEEHVSEWEDAFVLKK